MSLALFWIFAALTLLFGLGVVFFRSPVSSAMSLVMSFVGLAALFVTLDAFFIAVVQVLVYAGAVMVLFLFIIMLLDLRTEARRSAVGAILRGETAAPRFENNIVRHADGTPGRDLNAGKTIQYDPRNVIRNTGVKAAVRRNLKRVDRAIAARFDREAEGE